MRGIPICIELLLPKSTAMRDKLVIIQARTIDADNPESIANIHITTRQIMVFDFFFKNEKVLLAKAINIETLYPEAATI